MPICGTRNGSPSRHVRPDRRTLRLLELWTLKEALLKAIGEGLSVDPRTVSLDLDADGSVRLTQSPAGDESS